MVDIATAADSTCPDTGSGRVDNQHSTLPTSEQYREEANTRYTEAERAQAWTDARDVVKTYHTEVLEHWGKQLEVNLIFAGLFSAVVTAFTVQSYQSLQPAPTDASLLVLQQISSQLTSFTVNPSFVNSTHLSQSIDAQQSSSFRPPTAAVRINMLWFFSLSCSVLAALIALTMRQSLYMSGAGLSGDVRVQSRHRQYRLDGLLSWHAEIIITLVPLLLQLSAIAFLAGFVIFLWDLNRAIAIVAGIPAIVVLLLFTITTIVMPIVFPDCPYRSMLGDLSFQCMEAGLTWLSSQYGYLLPLIVNKLPYPIRRVLPPLTLLFKSPRLNLIMAIKPLRFAFSNHPLVALEACLREPTSNGVLGIVPLDWSAIERIVTSHPRTSRMLDRNTAVTAYAARLALDDLAKASIFFVDLGPEQVPEYCRDIWRTLQSKRWHIQSWGGTSHPILMAFQDVLFSALRFMLATDIPDRDHQWITGVLSLLDLWCSTPLVSPRDKRLCIETLLSIAGDACSAKLAGRALRSLVIRILRTSEHLEYSPSTINTALAVADKWITVEGETADGSDPDVYVYAAEIVAHYILLFHEHEDMHPSIGVPSAVMPDGPGRVTLRNFSAIISRWQTSERALKDLSRHGNLCNALATVLFTLKQIGHSIDYLQTNGLPPLVEEKLAGFDNTTCREKKPLAGWKAYEREFIARNMYIAVYYENSSEARVYTGNLVML